MTALAGQIFTTLYNKAAPRTPDIGDLKVWWIPQVPTPTGKTTFEYPVKSLREASLLLEVLAAYDDYQYWVNVKGDYCNMGGLLVYQGDEGWCDWESDDCDDFDQWCEEHPSEVK